MAITINMKNKLFSRLLLVYHMVLLPIIVLALFLYIWTYDNAREDITRQTKAQIVNYLEGFNQEMEWMAAQQYHLLQDYRLQTLSIAWDKLNAVERKEHIVYFIDRLNSIKTTSAYIDDIAIYMMEPKKMISTKNTVQDLDTTVSESIANNQIMLDQTNQRLTYTVSNLSRTLDGIPAVSVVVTFDIQKLAQSLDYVNTYEDGGMYVLSEKLEPLWQSTKRPFDLEAIIDSISNHIDGEDSVIEVNGEKYQVSQERLNHQSIVVASFIPLNTLKEPLEIFRQWGFVFVCFIALAILTYAYTTYRFVQRPLYLLRDAFRDVERGDLSRQIDNHATGEFRYIFTRFNKMVHRLNALVERDYRQKLMVQEAELKQLQSQINPHFLYNSLFILHSLARTEDTERIESFTLMLGEYFKFITKNDLNTVDLKSEVTHAKMYADIQSMRFSRRITVEFGALPPIYDHVDVPKLILQPIIENAYKYALERKAEKGYLRVDFTVRDKGLTIVVEDNGDDLSDTDIMKLNQSVSSNTNQASPSGLINIDRRLKLTFGDASGLIFTRSEWGGLKVELTIPMKEV
jgi:two-component system sensor histidine kinase YesM